MSLTQVSVIDRIEVVENGILQIRQRNDIQDGGNTIASNFHRWTLTPGQDTTGQDARVVAIAAATWTPEVIAAYEAQVAAAQKVGA